MAEDVTVLSPAGKVAARVGADSAGHLVIEASFNGKTVLEESPVGVRIAGRDFGAAAVIGEVEIRSVDEAFPWRGVKNEVRNYFNESTIAISAAEGVAPWKLQVRAYGDGVAWRMMIESPGPHTVESESTAFILPEGSRAWCQDNTAAYEGSYTDYRLSRDFTNPRPKIVGMPVTCELPGGGYALVSEADVMGYSGMSLTLDEKGIFQARFEDDPDGWTMSGAFATPWRVVAMASDLDGLVNSTLISKVCPAPDPKLFPKGMEEEWIQPGRSLWQWWAYDAAGAEWSKQKWFVDHAAELNCDYYLVDDGWENPKYGWMAGDRDGWDRMAELVEYAKSKGVKIWLWKPWTTKPKRNWIGIETPAKRKEFFEKCARIGVVGVKIDFMNSESQAGLEFYRDCLEQGAKNHIMINFHGANKPAGEMRTWPHEMAREGIRGLEYNKWIELPRSHYATLPFTRLVAGHGDFTPLTLQKEWQKGTTSSQQLASAIVLGSPLLCWADKPDVYLAQPAEVLRMIREMPTSWDETRVLPGSRIGQLAAFARRAGDEWWIAVINGTDQSTDYQIATDFLKSGAWKGTSVGDVNRQPDQMKIDTVEWEYGKPVDVLLRPGGGFVVHLKQ